MTKDTVKANIEAEIVDLQARLKMIDDSEDFRDEKKWEDFAKKITDEDTIFCPSCGVHEESNIGGKNGISVSEPEWPNNTNMFAHCECTVCGTKFSLGFSLTHTVVINE